MTTTAFLQQRVEALTNELEKTKTQLKEKNRILDEYTRVEHSMSLQERYPACFKPFQSFELELS